MAGASREAGLRTGKSETHEDRDATDDAQDREDTDRTRWLFVRSSASMGVLAQVKRRSQGRERSVVDAAARMASSLWSTGPHDRSAYCRRPCLEA